MREGIERRLRQQEGVIAAWQLIRDGHSRAAVRHAVAGLSELHDGVYLSGHARPTREQEWRAATLTSPGTLLSHRGCSGLFGYDDAWRQPPKRISVTRQGNGGVRPEGHLLVYYSSRVAQDARVYRGIPVLSPARGVLDLVAIHNDWTAARVVRDALRVEAVNNVDLHAIVAAHPGRRGVARLRAWSEEYAALPVTDAKSDAEVLAAALITAAGLPTPLVNAYHAGGEADLSWLERRLIIELDGPRNHKFPSYDAIKQRRWERAGWFVRRLPTDDVYNRPAKLLAAVRAPTPAELAR